jgi:hypothetical protein
MKMDLADEKARYRKAVDSAIANNRLDGFTPTDFGLAVFELWVARKVTGMAVTEVLQQHHASLEKILAANSDHNAPENLLKITDSKRLKDYEADITTMRMAELALTN